ncbi:hypothetical protein C8R45DRAFT_995684 [Mycena sanguinolenta]|nr:hypothetical protein C8R45DRAFT_995684 [Mycena sanguinolenta]
MGTCTCGISFYYNPGGQQPPPPPLSLHPEIQPVVQPPPPPLPLHPEIRSVVQLTTAHAQKVYFSGPLVRRIERQPDGQRPAEDEGWTDVWAQLAGTTLSIWDMKQVQEASAQGKEVPPTYINMTDAFVHVLGSVTVPETENSPAKRYPDILYVTSAGSNLILFSCPSTQALLSWAAALRLSLWEKSRLEEIYTAHLLRIILTQHDHQSTLHQGRLEGWVRIRIAGQTDWKKVWMCVAAAADAAQSDAPTTPGRTKKRMSKLFFFKDNGPPDMPLASKPVISKFASPKPKDRRKPVLTFYNATQAFAIYPERPELIGRSTLIKLQGLIGDEESAGYMGRQEGWLLIMPELEGGLGPAEEMLKWIVALHDAFQLYGRPQGWTWDPRDPASLMFAYPVGPHSDLLFLQREQAETLDVRDDRTSSIRSKLLNILYGQMVSRTRQAEIDGHDRHIEPAVVDPAPNLAANVDDNDRHIKRTASLSKSSSESQPETRKMPEDRPAQSYVNNLLATWERRKPLLSMLMVADSNRQGHELRKDLDNIESQIGRLLTHILEFRDAGQAARQLEGSDALSLIDAIQDVLDRGTLPDATLRSKARKLLHKVSEAQLPSSLFIAGVNDHDEHPTFSGGFGDVYRALYQGPMVALKRIRIFTADSSTHRNRLVRILPFKYASSGSGLLYSNFAKRR